MTYTLESTLPVPFDTVDGLSDQAETQEQSATGLEGTQGSLADREMTQLVQRVFLKAYDKPFRRVAFCGVDDKGSSSAVCAHAAKVLASQTSASICVLDANFKDRRVSQILSSHAVEFDTRRSAISHPGCTQIAPNLWYSAPETALIKKDSLARTRTIEDQFARVLSRFDYVLIDCPAMDVSVDALLLGQIADAAILVVEANSTRRVTARKAKESLESAGVYLLGTVLNNRELPIPESLYRRL